MENSTNDKDNTKIQPRMREITPQKDCSDLKQVDEEESKKHDEPNTNENNNTIQHYDIETNINSNSRFTIVDEPSSYQRVSYRNEPRFLVPNPIVVKLKDSNDGFKLPKILCGSALACLVDSNGKDLSYLSCEKGLSQELDENLQASFPLKVHQTSVGKLFRLVFRIRYTACRARQEESSRSPGASPGSILITSHDNSREEEAEAIEVGTNFQPKGEDENNNKNNGKTGESITFSAEELLFSKGFCVSSTTEKAILKYAKHSRKRKNS